MEVVTLKSNPLNKMKSQSVTFKSQPVHHPGLWQSQTAINHLSHVSHSITILNTQSQGCEELIQMSQKLVQLSQEGRWIVLISPPNIGYKTLMHFRHLLLYLTDHFHQPP